jgi:predicted nucleic acid-binding protein
MRIISWPSNSKTTRSTRERSPQRLRASSPPPALVTTSYVFDEVVTYLKSRRQHERACRVGNLLLTSPIVRLFYVDEELFEQGWKMLQQHDDKTYSLTDCISFVLMRQMGIRTAFTFDHHFRQAGFETEP